MTPVRAVSAISEVTARACSTATEGVFSRRSSSRVKLSFFSSSGMVMQARRSSRLVKGSSRAVVPRLNTEWTTAMPQGAITLLTKVKWNTAFRP